MGKGNVIKFHIIMDRWRTIVPTKHIKVKYDYVNTHLNIK